MVRLLAAAVRLFLPVIASIYWGVSCGIADCGVGHFNLGVVFCPRLSICNLERSRWGFGVGGRYVVCTKLPCV